MTRRSGIVIPLLAGLALRAETQLEQIGRAELMLHNHDVAGAEELARNCAEAGPNSAEVHALLADLAYRKGDLPEAEREYRQSIALDPKIAHAWIGLGRVFNCASYRKSAQVYFRKAHELAPDDPEALRYWAATLKSSEQIPALERYLALVKNRDPEELDEARSQLEMHRAVGDKITFRLVSAYEPAEIKLELLLHDAQRIRAFGLAVGVNGEKPVKLLLDTGASGIVINSKTAEKAGIKRVTATKLKGLGDTADPTGYFGLAERITVGPVEFRDCIVTVSDRRTVVDDAGLIGADVFARFLVTLDFQQRLMRLRPLPSRPEADGPYDRVIAPEMKSFTPVYQVGRHLLVPTVADGSIPALFMIDTGASLTLISRDLAARVGRIHSDQTIRLRGVSGNVKDVFEADEVELQFAGFRQKNKDAVLADLTKTSNAFDMEIGGLFGFRMLTLFTLSIDYRDGLVNFGYGPRR